MSDVILFGTLKPGVYRLDDIYDPDEDGVYEAANGKIVPAVKSIIIDNNNVVYIVTAVDVTTYKVTMVAAKIVLEDPADASTLISYGNEQYMLYYDDRVSPTKLVVDSKFVIFGTNSVEYKLYKEVDGVKVSIALFLDEEGEIDGDRIPIASTQAPGILKPSNCHTLTSLVDGDIVTYQEYDGAGILTKVVTFTCKKASILNDLSSAANPVVEFNATVNQSSGDNWLLYVGQSEENLSIFPEIVYSDGVKQYVPINNQNCFLYGMEDVTTNYPGMKFPVVLKYFLATNVESPIADDGERFITLDRWVVVDVKSKHEFSKISVIPIWNSTTSKWELRYYAYYDARNTYENVTSSVTYTAGMAYNDTITMEQQTIQIELLYTPEEGDEEQQSYQQAITLTLKTPNDTEPFLISDSVDSSFVYGSNDTLHSRPRIEYDSSIEQYFIPTSFFPDSDSFIENFYTNANPPYLEESEIEAPTPDYFTIREVSSGRVLLATPIAISQYEQAFNILVTGLANQYVDSTVVVEFLIADGDTWNLLFGVPVEVKLSTLGYNL